MIEDQTCLFRVQTINLTVLIVDNRWMCSTSLQVPRRFCYSSQKPAAAWSNWPPVSSALEAIHQKILLKARCSATNLAFPDVNSRLNILTALQTHMHACTRLQFGSLHSRLASAGSEIKRTEIPGPVFGRSGMAWSSPVLSAREWVVRSEIFITTLYSRY